MFHVKDHVMTGPAVAETFVPVTLDGATGGGDERGVAPLLRPESGSA